MYTISKRDEVLLQFALITSDDNKWYAKQYYMNNHGYYENQELTHNDLCLYWTECGAANWFREVFLKELPFVMSDDNIWFAKEHYVKSCGYPSDYSLTIMELYRYWALCGASKWFRETYLEEKLAKTA